MIDLEDGESCEMQGSGRKPYVLKNVGGVYSCSCPAWRNQSVAIETRTCKHLRKLRGDAAETARVGNPLPAVRAAAKDAPPILLAHSWDNATDLSDWWISEKLDGVRAYWTGTKFLSRQGNEYHAPDWFCEGLPETPLDGELWMDRGAFQRTVSVVRRQDGSEHWKTIRYVVFDAPESKAPFEERLAVLQETVANSGNAFTTVLEQQRCEGEAHLRERLAAIEAIGGEGLMLRQPASLYEVGRSMTLLKVKTFHDAGALVIGHSAGKGRHKGTLGALIVRLPDGTEFNVGTGFTDAQRKAPPAVGSSVTFRYQELTDGGVPRFPSFLRTDSAAPFVEVPSAAPTAEAATAATVAASSADASYYELEDEKSAKFWEVTAAGNEVTVRYGKIGARGQTRTKSFDSFDAAAAYRNKVTAEKMAKGYEASDPPAEN